MFYDRFYELCQKSGVTPTQVARDLGLRQSTVSMWKKQGTTPKYETLLKLSDYFGATIDYLTGLTKDPRTQTLSLQDDQLSDEIDDADAELVDAVHQICGMDRYKIADDYAMGNLREIWNPAKIHLVREYIQDSQAVLKKMFTAAGYGTEKAPPAPPEGTDTTPGEKPAEGPPEGE